MKNSLGKKICVIGLGLITGFVLLNIILTYFLLIPFSTFLSANQMEEIAIDIEERKLYSKEDFEQYIEEISEDMNTQLTLIDGETNVIMSEKASISYNNEINNFLKKFFNKNKKKMDTGKSVSIRRGGEVTNRINVILMKKIADDRYIILSRSYRSLQNATKSAMIFNVISGVIIILIGWIYVYRISRYLVVPICNMKNVAEDISNLKFDAKIEMKSQDELGELGTSINKMSEHLEENLLQLQGDIESRKRLVRNLSHEIKSPVAVIMGYSDRMKKIIKQNPEKALEYCEIISNESNRVDVIVKEMLELSRMEQGLAELNKERFEVSNLFVKLKNRFTEENLEKRIQYNEQYDSKEIINADILMLERAVYNLLDNAVMHGNTEDMRICVRGERKEEYYEFRIYNTGSHIEETEITSLWEPFNKVDKVRTRGTQGHGVGLAIVREIVEAHDGYYSVQNFEDGVEFLIAIRG